MCCILRKRKKFRVILNCKSGVLKLYLKVIYFFSILDFTMMTTQKYRMTMVDIRCCVNALKPKIVNLRLANVYNLNLSKRLYLLKFAAGDKKCQVVIESGIRFHATDWQRDKDVLPSAFVMRLRKFLRTRRLLDFKQLGADRVIDFIFQTGSSVTHLIIELYVSVIIFKRIDHHSFFVHEIRNTLCLIPYFLLGKRLIDG
jgi:hypothetical protein